MDRQRRHREDEASDERRSRTPGPTTADGADAAIVDLQATAGNRAVTELLGPTAGDVAIQRDTTDGTPPAEPTDTSTATGSTMSIPDLKLSVRVESVQQGGRGGGRVGGAGSKGEGSTSGEVTVTFKAEDLDPRLMEAAAKGRQFGVVTITIGSVTMTLHDVVISSAQMSGETASLSLNFSSREFTPGAGGG